jgi:hypothetical protein
MMPLTDLDIWRTAKILIDAHGENAPLEAAQRADWAIQDGNAEAESVWMRVLKAVEALQRHEEIAGQSIH